MIRISTILVASLLTISANAQLFYSTDFSSTDNWVTLNPTSNNHQTSIDISGGTCNFHNLSGYETMPGVRTYHSLGETVQYPFRIEAAFRINSFEWGWAGAMLPFILTAGNQDPIATANGYAPTFSEYTNQNAVGLAALTNYNSDAPIYLRPFFKQGQQVFNWGEYTVDGQTIIIEPYTDYQISLEMFSSISGRIEAKNSNTNVTQWLCFDLPMMVPGTNLATNIVGMNTVQISGMTWADPNRSISGIVDNLSIRPPRRIDCYTVSTSNEQNANPITLFPNPTNGHFTGIFPTDVNQIEVYDAIGKKIMTTQNNNIPLDFDLTLQPAGVYFLRTDKGQTQKIIKQ